MAKGSSIEICVIFRSEGWPRCAPSEAGFDSSPLDEVDGLMRKAEANGMLIRNGYVVAEWSYGGAQSKAFHAMSIGKSFTSLALGLALQDKIIPSLDAKVREVYPRFAAGPFTDLITIRHLATMTAGIKSSRHQLNYTKWLPPGVTLIYHADHCAHLARVLTYVYGRTLHSVLNERILEPIGAQMDWEFDEHPWSPITTRDGREVPVNTGYGAIHLRVDDLARVGRLCVNWGLWDGKQLISADYLKECWTEIPQKDLRPTGWGLGYGLYWWRLVPGVWFMSGWGGQFCMVWPEGGIVMVKLNECSERHTRLDGDKYIDLRKIFPLVYRSLTGEQFAIPLEWKVAWTARGYADGAWEIPGESDSESTS